MWGRSAKGIWGWRVVRNSVGMTPQRSFALLRIVSTLLRTQRSNSYVLVPKRLPGAFSIPLKPLKKGYV